MMRTILDLLTGAYFRPHFLEAIVSAVVGSIVSDALSDDDSGGSQARQSNAQAERYYGELADVTKGQFEISKEQYELWKTETLPIIRQVAANIQVPGGEEGAISEAVGDVRGQYAVAGERMNRALELSRGPADPIYALSNQQLASAESGDVAEAITNARNMNREREWNRRLQAIAAYGDPTGAALAASQAGSANLGRAASGQTAIANSYLSGQRLADERAGRAGYAAGAIFDKALKSARTPPFVPGNESGWFSGDSSYYSGGGGGGSDYADPWSGGVYGGGARDGGAIRAYAEGGDVGGGIISGPGTGTSDSIPMRAKPGSYILSADTVRAIGQKKVHDLIDKSGVRPGQGGDSYSGVAIKTSNGEAEIPPQTVAYYGEEFFNKLQQKYHRPVMDEPGGAANGGAIRMRKLPRMVEDAIFQTSNGRALRR